MKSENPLVSVVVITYNSEKTVIETLDSIKEQTYSNIELIITDDCSQDKTIEICKNWIDKNSKFFINTEIITTSKNTGISANSNRGYYKAKGKWIKGIAGDDILINTCIESNVDYILKNPNTELLFSKFKPTGSAHLLNKISNYNYGVFRLKPKELLYRLLICNPFPAPTLFIKKSVFMELGGYEENIPLLEDWPFWIKAVQNSKRISFNNSYTAYYRVSENSISLSTKVNPLYHQTLEQFNRRLYNIQWKTNKLIWLYYYNNKKRKEKKISAKILSCLFKYINPITYYYKYIDNKIKRFNKEYECNY